MVPARVNARITKLARSASVDGIGSPVETYTGGAAAVSIDVYFETQSATTFDAYDGERSASTGIVLLPPRQTMAVADRFELDGVTYEVTGVRDVRDATGLPRHREASWKEVQE